MFEFEYKGAGAGVIKAKKDSLYIDPKLSLYGAKDVTTNGGVELATEPRFAVYNDAAKLVIDGPGEYEVGPFAITGFAFRRNIDSLEQGKKATAYRVVVDGIAIAVLGHIDNEISENQLEELGLIDVLIIPVGGNGYTFDGVAAARIAKIMEPKLVVPVHYADDTLAYEVPQNEVTDFISAIGAGGVEHVIKLKVKATSLPAAMTTVVVDRSK